MDEIPHFGVQASHWIRNDRYGKSNGDLPLLLEALERNLVEPLNQKIEHPFAFRKYSRYLDKIINTNLRNGKISPNIDNIVLKMEEDIRSAPEYEDIVLYRGLKDVLEVGIGDRISDKGFMSKSISSDIANKFSKLGTFLILHYPGITKQVYMADYSLYPEEKEMLGLQGEEFIVKATATYQDYNFVYAVFDKNVSYDLEIDEEIDKKFNEIKLLYSLFEEELKENYIFLKVKDPNKEGSSPLISWDRDLPDWINGENIPVYLVGRTTPDQLFSLIMMLYYQEELLEIFSMSFEEYGDFNVSQRRGDLLITNKDDVFSVAYVMFYEEYEKIEGSIPLPTFKSLWKNE